MRRKLRTAAMMVALAIGAATTSLRAGPIEPKYVPVDAKWVVHVDVDAIVKSKLLAMLGIDLNFTDGKPSHVGPVDVNGMSDQEIQKIVTSIQGALGMKIPDDIHGLTLVGRSFDEEGVVLIIKAKVDKDRLIGMAKIGTGYTSKMYHGVEISSYRPDKDDNDEDDAVSGAFLAEDVLIIARRAKDVQHAIDMMPGKSANLKGDLVDHPVASSGAVMVYMAGEGLAQLQEDEDLSPVIAPIQTVRASIGEQGEDVVLKAEARVKTAEAARQVRGALEGVRALANLATLDSSGNEEAKMVANLAGRATVEVNDAIVTVTWPVAMTTIRDMVSAEINPPKKKHKATTQALVSTRPVQVKK